MLARPRDLSAPQPKPIVDADDWMGRTSTSRLISKTFVCQLKVGAVAGDPGEARPGLERQTYLASDLLWLPTTKLQQSLRSTRGRGMLRLH